MQDQRFVLIVVQEPVLTVQLHFHNYSRLYRGVDFARGKCQNSASAGSSPSTGKNKNFDSPESINILFPAVRFPINSPSEVSPQPRLSYAGNNFLCFVQFRVFLFD